MKFFFIILGIVLLLVAYPYIRLFVKRISLTLRIKRLCRRHHYNFHKTHFAWQLGRRSAQHCDFYIETASTVYAVKLFSAKRRHSELRLTEAGTYFFRSFIAFASVALVRMPLDSAQKPFPPYNFRYDMPERFYTKRIKPVLLIHPVCLEIKYLKGNEERVISSGEMINDVYIFSLSRFVGELRSNE